MGGLNSLFFGACSSQPLYWGEGVYDMENVRFGMNVDQFYSKAKEMRNFKTKEEEETCRCFKKEKIECDTPDGKKTWVYQYESDEIKSGEVMARFGRFRYPYTGMVADHEGRLIGVLAKGIMKSGAEVDALLLALADTYGRRSKLIENPQGHCYFGWYAGDRTIQLRVGQISESGDFVEKSAGCSKGCVAPKYEVCLKVTDTAHDPLLDQISSGEWSGFADLSSVEKVCVIEPQKSRYAGR